MIRIAARASHTQQQHRAIKCKDGFRHIPRPACVGRRYMLPMPIYSHNPEEDCQASPKPFSAPNALFDTIGSNQRTARQRKNNIVKTISRLSQEVRKLLTARNERYGLLK